MSQTQLSANSEPKTSVHNHAFRVVATLLGATLIVGIFYLYLAFLLRAWQVYVLAATVFGFGLGVIISLVLTQRGKSTFGMWIVMGGMFMIFPLTSLLIANIGLTLGLSLILLTAAITAQTLPTKHVSWAIGAGFAVSVITVLVDTYGPNFRLVVPQLQTFLPVITTIVVIVYGFFVARQFPNYTLRTKLITAFLVITLLGVGTVAFFTNRATSNALTENVGNNLKSLANSQALTIGDLLARQIDALRSLSLSRRLRDRLVLPSTEYGSNATEIEARLKELDEAWIGAADESDPLLRSRLRNGTAVELLAFREAFPDHVEIFVTDQYGGLMATTNRTSDYYQADEDWWQAAFNNGRGAVFISGQPMFDTSSNTFGLVIALPFYNDDGVVIGILRSTYRLTTLASLVSSTEAGQESLYTNLLIPGGQLLDTREGTLTRVEPAFLSHLEQLATEPYAEFDFRGVPSFVSQAPVTAITGEPAIANLDWAFVVHQDRMDALASIEAQNRNTILLAVLIAGFAVVTAVGVAQILATPIVRLTNAAQQVAAGNLDAQASVESRDEIGTLATAFNTMTGQLQAIIATLEEQVADRTRQLETVVEVSQRLSGILDLSDLMRTVVTVTKETFNYYHVHIYLLDDKREMLIMAEGYGEAGVEMRRRGHAIALTASKSLVARAAREGRIITVENVRDDPDWLPNPLLPDTHSEMAVPVRLGAEVVGVLDVQSERVGGLTEEDVATMQVLANTVATAIRNARLFTETQDALDQAQSLQRLYTGQAWEKFASVKSSTNYEFRQPDLPPLDYINTPEAEEALQQGKTVNLHLSNGEATSEELITDGLENTTLATPLKLGDAIIGVLGVRDNDPRRQWTGDEIALIEAVSEQMSLAIENARLFEETQRNAWRDRVVSESTAKVWSSAEIEEVLRNAVAQLGDKLRASEVVIRLGANTEMAMPPDTSEPDEY